MALDDFSFFTLFFTIFELGMTFLLSFNYFWAQDDLIHSFLTISEFMIIF